MENLMKIKNRMIQTINFFTTKKSNAFKTYHLIPSMMTFVILLLEKSKEWPIGLALLCVLHKKEGKECTVGICGGLSSWSLSLAYLSIVTVFLHRSVSIPSTIRCCLWRSYCCHF